MAAETKNTPPTSLSIKLPAPTTQTANATPKGPPTPLKAPPSSRVYWSDDVMIDPNIFFGTANVSKVNSIWSRVRTPTHDVTRARTPSCGQYSTAMGGTSGTAGGQQQQTSTAGKKRWGKTLVRLGSVSSWNTSAATQRRPSRGVLLVEKVAENARVSRQNSFENSNSPDGPSSARRKLSTITRAGEFIRKFTSKQRSSSESSLVDDVTAKDKFRMLVKRVSFARKMSNDDDLGKGKIVTDIGGQAGQQLPRRTFSFSDVTMGALYQTVDRKRLARLHKWSAESNRKRKLLAKFRRAARIVIFCIRQTKDHSVKSLESNEFSPFMKFDIDKEFETVDLLFDPSKFKANRKSRITDEFVRVMSLEPEDRSPQEIYYAQIALRNIECFMDFPARMQRKIAECGMYEKYEAQRVLVRQGHPAFAYYFILSGAVAVMVLEEGEAFAKPAAFLTKGQTFGELAIIKRSRRASSIIAREESQFLTLSVDDYHKIFMAGGVKTMNDPDHDEFLQSLTFMKSWPLKLLTEKSNRCLFLYFKRGDVLVKDSQYSDWLIIVKSGSVAVLKKLKKVHAYDWKNVNRGSTFVSEKIKRDRQVKRAAWRRLVLPELKIPLKNHEDPESVEEEDPLFDEQGQRIPFTHPDPQSNQNNLDPLTSSTSRKVWNFGNSEHNSRKPAQSRLEVSHVQLPSVKVTSATDSVLMMSSQTRHQKATRLPGETDSNELDSPRNKSHNTKGSSLKAEGIESRSGDGFKSQIRTINTDLDSGFQRKDPDDITEADLNPEFVHIQTLTKGRVFGLSDLILGKQTSFCVVSNGADCLLISKQLFSDNMPESLYRQLRMDLCPYPTEEELQSSLQVSVDWHAFKANTLTKTLNSVTRRRQANITA